MDVVPERGDKLWKEQKLAIIWPLPITALLPVKQRISESFSLLLRGLVL